MTVPAEGREKQLARFVFDTAGDGAALRLTPAPRPRLPLRQRLKTLAEFALRLVFTVGALYALAGGALPVVPHNLPQLVALLLVLLPLGELVLWVERWVHLRRHSDDWNDDLEPLV